MFSINGSYAGIKDLFNVKNDKEIYVFYMNGVISTYYSTEKKLMATVNRVSRSGFCDWSYDKMLFSDFLEELIEKNTTQNDVYIDHDTTLFSRLLDLFEWEFDKDVSIILKGGSRDCNLSDYDGRIFIEVYESGVVIDDYDGRISIEEHESDVVIDVTNTLRVFALQKQYC